MHQGERMAPSRLRRVEFSSCSKEGLMTYRALRFSRRTLAAALAALALASAGLPTVTRAEPAEVPAAQNRTYYSDYTKTEIVGKGQWTCQHTYVQFWGIVTAYYNYSYIDCNIDPEFR
jgi:hypothetical protein